MLPTQVLKSRIGCRFVLTFCGVGRIFSVNRIGIWLVIAPFVLSEYIFHANAGIAQLVERNLAKVDVAGSSPVSRSIPFSLIISQLRVVQLSRQNQKKSGWLRIGCGSIGEGEVNIKALATCLFPLFRGICVA